MTCPSVYEPDDPELPCELESGHKGPHRVIIEWSWEPRVVHVGEVALAGETVTFCQLEAGHDGSHQSPQMSLEDG